jgi:uncharacterized protein YjiS (DUF1127 family)
MLRRTIEETSFDPRRASPAYCEGTLHMSRYDQAPALTHGQQLVTGEVRVLLARLGARAAGLGARWAARRNAARDVRQLYLSTDRELRDMGLNRSDLPAIIRGVYRRD